MDCDKHKWYEQLIQNNKEYYILSVESDVLAFNDAIKLFKIVSSASRQLGALERFSGLQTMRDTVGGAFVLRIQPGNEPGRLMLEVVQKSSTANAQCSAYRIFGKELESCDSDMVGFAIVENFIASVVNQLVAGATSVQDVKLHPNVEWKRISNKIGQKTRRGAGNLIICSPTTAKQYFAKLDTTRIDEFPQFKSLKYLGRHDNAHAVMSSEVVSDDTILVGYNGQSDFDAGFVVCPYRIQNVKIQKHHRDERFPVYELVVQASIVDDDAKDYFAKFNVKEALNGN